MFASKRNFAVLSDPKVWLDFKRVGNVEYFTVRKEMNAEDCEAACREINGHLASINTEEEKNALMSTIEDCELCSLGRFRIPNDAMLTQ